MNRLFFNKSLSFWIGFCGLACIAQTRLLLGQRLALTLEDAFVMGGLVSGYQIVRRENRDWGVIFLGTSLALFSFLHFNLQQQLFCLLPGTLWLLYDGENILNLTKAGYKARGLRYFVWSKPVVVAFVWACLTVILPCLSSQTPWTGAFLERFLFVFALALAYDLLDLECDRKYGLKTLAAQWGTTQTMAWIALFFVGSTGMVWQMAGGHNPVFLLLFPLISICCVYYLGQVQVRIEYTKMMVDSLMILQVVWTALYLWNFI